MLFKTIRIIIILNENTKKKDIIVADRETGTVKWYNRNKGYGFIERKEGKDLFVHQNAIREKGYYEVLKEGEQVEFTFIEGKKGPQADDVVVLD